MATPEATHFERTAGNRGARTPWLCLLTTCLSIAGCSGSSSNPSASPGGEFSLLSTSVTSGQTWQINRPFMFRFSQSGDFSTVSRNTIRIQREGGQPAFGDFSLDPLDLDPVDGKPRAVLFQPICPTLGDFSDAGFEPNGVRYQVDLPGMSSGATTVRSLRTGQALETDGYTLTFVTASDDLLAELFLDPVLGPPAPLLRPSSEVACRVEVIDPETGEVVAREFHQELDGSASLEEGYLVPNNLYSAPETQVTIYLELNQPVSPTADNINDDRLRLEYLTLAGTWSPLPIELELVANCTDSGATVRLIPIGILPQDRALRVVVTAQFEDLVGDRNIVALDRFALMQTDAQLDHLGAPAQAGDELFEPFNPYDNAFEDTTSGLDAPRSTWGDESSGDEGLQATFAFDGTGGPQGEFDLKIESGTEVIFDTTATTFIGGPDFSPQYTQLAVGGRLDVRHLLIEEGGALRCQGPNPARILATGDVTVRGTLSVDGSDAGPVVALDTPFLAESGAAGQGGGGDGGTGSYLTSQVTPRGQNGFGAFQVANQGGEGGESGWHPSNHDGGYFRRAGGGGGGRLGHDVLVHGTDGVTLCPTEWVYGLNAESGFLGHDNATSSQGPHKPYGGHVGPSPFTSSAGPSDDFFGVKRKNFDTAQEALVIGELPTPWPGAGGGAGGDATRTDTYPPTIFVHNAQDKGAGGGGGAGALTVMALSRIIVEGHGSITAIGGHGSGGENTTATNRIGGGSGGGSGGHLILQAGLEIDLSGAFLGGQSGVTKEEQLFHAINARGGEGGAGANNAGGAANNERIVRRQDAKHTGTSSASDPQDNPWLPVLPQTCIDYNTSILGSNQNYVVRCAGGDGGPGLVQLHVGNLSGAPAEHDIKYPGGEIAHLRDLVWPPPHGLNELTWIWEDQLLPSFGRFSKTQSTWIPLGAATVAPGSSTPDPLVFLFDGVDPSSGKIARDESGGTIEDLAPLLQPAAAIESPGLPDRRSANTVRFDAAELVGGNEIYARNPSLLRRFRLTIGPRSFTVASAKYLGDGDLATGNDYLDVTVTESIDEDGHPPTGQLSLIPRYFTVTTLGVEDSLPATASVKIEFQATSANSQGDPDESSVFPDVSLWATDISQLNEAPANTGFRFFRYRVTFDIAEQGELSADMPRPVLDFLRIPFRF